MRTRTCTYKDNYIWVQGTKFTLKVNKKQKLQNKSADIFVSCGFKM